MEAGHQPEQARPCICACAAAKKAKVTILAGDDAPVAESEGVEESEEAERHKRRECMDVTAETDEGCDYS